MKKAKILNIRPIRTSIFEANFQIVTEQHQLSGLNSSTSIISDTLNIDHLSSLQRRLQIIPPTIDSSS